MADHIDALYAEIEKAKGLLPRGGSTSAHNRVGRLGFKAAKDRDWDRAGRASRAQSYLGTRKRGASRTAAATGKFRHGKYK